MLSPESRVPCFWGRWSPESQNFRDSKGLLYFTRKVAKFLVGVRMSLKTLGTPRDSRISHGLNELNYIWCLGESRIMKTENLYKHLTLKTLIMAVMKFR